MTHNMLRMAILVLSLLALTLTGSASSYMKPVQQIDLTDKSQAMVTFLRTTSFGGAIQFGIWDRDNFVGVLSANSYIQYLAAPGDHIFLARAENWSCVKAKLEAGKKYYIVAKVFPGFFRARVAFDPVRSIDEPQSKIDEWLTELTPTAVDESQRSEYAEPRVEQVKERAKGFEEGDGKCEMLELTDGR